ncbi:MAG TPA: TIGR03067 domain-containing protein [Gemmataceae bacterium]|nr:TIGR03067 domain-containing protein [Gemmataceae bacterium]
MKLTGLLVLGLLILRLTAALAADDGNQTETDPIKDELSHMQGTWTYQTQTIGGRQLSKQDRDNIWMVIDGDVMTRTGNAGGGIKHEITLNLNTNPKSIDLVYVHPSVKNFCPQRHLRVEG